jgi:hypothetical protein
MTKEDAYKLKYGDVVYIWGDKTKPQRISWEGYNNFHQKTDSIRFERGDFFCIEHDYEHIELSPPGTIPEPENNNTVSILVSKNNGPEFFPIDFPADNRRNQVGWFKIINKIEKSPYGYYYSFNQELFKKKCQ